MLLGALESLGMCTMHADGDNWVYCIRVDKPSKNLRHEELIAKMLE